jgi:hypothetical protein
MMVQMVQSNETWLLWGRGTGKTVGGIGPWMARVAEAMPGHLSGLFGKDFETLEKNILPKFIQGMELAGYYRDQHFVVGKRPPSRWPNCLYSIKRWDRTIAWHNGTVFQEISLFNKGSANAFDFQSGAFDEVKFMDPGQLEDEVYPTFRGYEKLFGHLPEYLSKIYATDKYADHVQIKWILNKRSRHDQRKVETVIRLQLHLNDLYLMLPKAGRNKGKTMAAIRQIESHLRELRKDLVFVSEASARTNIENLGKRWLTDKRRTMAKYEYAVAIENEDPIKAEDSFYPSLTEESFYGPEVVIDVIPTQPFVIALDYQHSVTPLLVTQALQLIGQSKPSVNFVKEFYTTPPEGISECIKQFCRYYTAHANKVAYYVYDATATGARQSAKRFKDIVIDELRRNGWHVVECYIGDPPDHFLKYQSIKRWMEGPDDQAYLVKFNKAKCPKTEISMQGAGAIVVNGKTKKDKKYEQTNRFKSIDQTETTHFSDVVDQLLWYWFGTGKAITMPGTGVGVIFR